MVTGKSPERYCLARVAIQCFLLQTYPNKELLIINDGDQPLTEKDGRIREFRLPRKSAVTLGDLRNIGLEQAKGDWVIQWDYDDWHAASRIALQMAAARPEAAVLLRNQMRYNFGTRSGFALGVREGLHGTILHPRASRCRYPRQARGEDTVFMGQFPQRIVLDNDPGEYVRFFHGQNTWQNEQHIMQKLAGVRDALVLSAEQTKHLLSPAQ